MVAANMFNKQSRTANKGWSLELGEVLTIPDRKNLKVLRIIHRGLGTELTEMSRARSTNGGRVDVHTGF
jgi:hypothetical protein